MDMLTKSVKLSIKSIKEAPNYQNTPERFEAIKMTNVIVVEKGMESGKPSIDIQCEDSNGNKFLIITTGEILKMMAAACEGVELRGQDKQGLDS